ncbi:hypothetical protein HMPREF0083_05389 [Aneurinibacillus aneurinilyticus ATCC 12856]|uniref:Uncharacterized protein n=1 Tax=Aneurinibacillus aneurinilyticus ATCC 12856 TaxID=649747 RepID=U1WV85_ANEAE|nr:hypothetical protein HMPREF0083_05389 [Aneurinibacillus aneurinilyticus ATCC 12856]
MGRFFHSLLMIGYTYQSHRGSYSPDNIYEVKNNCPLNQDKICISRVLIIQYNPK